MPIQIPNQLADPWSKHVCIRTSFEYQVLDEIRRKLGLAPKTMEAPAFEIDPKTQEYIRHCRLRVRCRSSGGFELPRPLYLGLDMEQQLIEVYFTNCLRATRSGNIKRDADHNWVYGRASLLDPKQITASALNKLIQQAMCIASAKYAFGGKFEKPMLKRAVEHPTVGPYILGESVNGDLG
jgi:hypothetical protein